jgi:hypothetical protein
MTYSLVNAINTGRAHIRMPKTLDFLSMAKPTMKARVVITAMWFEG